MWPTTTLFPPGAQDMFLPTLQAMTGNRVNNPLQSINQVLEIDTEGTNFPLVAGIRAAERPVTKGVWPSYRPTRNP